MPTLYSVTLATTSGGLAVPMLRPPNKVVPVPPDVLEMADGSENLLGLPGWDMFWDHLTITEFDDIISRCGGRTVHSFYGFVRMTNWKTRNAAQETWSDHTAWLHQPETGDWVIHGTRQKIRVKVREIEVLTDLAL